MGRTVTLKTVEICQILLRVQPDHAVELGLGCKDLDFGARKRGDAPEGMADVQGGIRGEREADLWTARPF